MRHHLVLALCATLAGCQGWQAPPAGFDYGEAPGPALRPVAEAQIRDALRDPDSARFRWGRPVRAYRNGRLVTEGGRVVVAGLAWPVAVSARNGFGGYATPEEWLCWHVAGAFRGCVPEALDGPLMRVVGQEDRPRLTWR